MSFITSVSGRACLSEWGAPLTVSDLLNLLSNLKRASTLAGRPVVLILFVREAVPIPDSYLLSCVQATLPAVLACCEALVVAVEGGEHARTAFGHAFQPKRKGPTPYMITHRVDTLAAAFERTQRLAPHDILELQRYALHHSAPPAGQWA